MTTSRSTANARTLRRDLRSTANARTLRRDLRSTAALLFVVLLFVGGTTIVALVGTGQTVDDLTARLDPLSDANRSLRQALTDAETGERGYLISGDDSFLEPFATGIEDFDRAAADLRRLVEGDELRDGVEEQILAGREWIDDFGVPVVALRAQDPDAALDWARSGAGRTRFERFREANGVVQVQLAADIASARTSVDRTQQVALAVLGGVLVITAGLAISSSVRTYRRIMAPLDDLTDTVERLGRRDLGARARVDGPAEISAVTTAVNDMAAEIEQLTVEQRRRAGQERAIRDVTGALFAADTIDGVLDTAARELASVLGADRVIVRRVDIVDAPVVSEWHDPEVGLAPDVPVSVELRRLVADRLADEPVLALDDVQAAHGDLGALADQLDALALRALAVTTVRSGEAVYLVAVHEVRRTRRWTSGDLAVLSAVGRATGVALDRAAVVAGQAHLIEELRQLDQAKDDFVSSVSHELRTPLTSLIGYAELLRDGDGGPLNPVQDGMVGVIERNGRRLRDLIEDLLTLSRINTGTLHHAAEQVDLVATLVEARRVLEPALGAGDVDVHWSIPDALPTIQGDRAQLERVVLNLVTNAVKFTLPGGQVEVTVTHGDHELLLRVADTGIGIPADELDDLFTRFYRATTAREHAIGGTGLGLVIVQTIVELHGGRVEVRSEVGVGTNVDVHLPLPDDATRGRARAEEAD